MKPHRLSQIGLSRSLKLNQLLIFDRVMETGSILRAAHEMRLSQPAVTKVIQELETSFQGALFSRSNRGVFPTELGHMVARRVKSLLAEFRYLTEELDQFRFGEAGHIVVGTLISASAHLLPLAITKLKARSPRVLVTVREGPTAHLFPALATGELDVVVGRLPETGLPLSDAFPLDHHALFDDSLAVVVGAGHDIAKTTSATLRDLASLPWILPTSESPLRQAVERMFRAADLSLPADLVESMSVLTNLGLLLDAPRVGVMPHVAAIQFVGSGLLTILNIRETGAFGTVGYSVRSGKVLTPACELFIECLREAVPS
ncbi:LysR substrate-binding domain-containing protein [Paraburkholderia sp. Cpub6]|uniref:LysR substrate-binding domain-containing protein n=1 Tax=Paraburkholderia sp. Cpub6 TaxID=2723094 RepID=UPI0016176EC2|nr:LysR substrate-binding domain-containing protein [Paraburkholderia sp. Cpub6]MBB5460219.1 DNA-binding transcriptional LysR family regulator [Paraburkholderia sp. Cpub6]